MRYPCRRFLLSSVPLAGAALTTSMQKAVATNAKKAIEFKYCLNTATIMGQNLELDKQFQIAKKAGFDGIEPWLRDMNKYKANSKSLKDLGKWAQDNNLTVEGCIGFPEWLAEDESKRASSLTQLHKDIDLLKELGCKRLAAPPAGATKDKNINLDEASQRFGKLAKICLEASIVPLVEIWGFSESINRLGQAIYIASECGYRGASVLADIYHLRRGGSGLNGLLQLGANSMQLLHVNDYPSNIKPDKLNDSDRIFPGDGSAPWNDIASIVKQCSRSCVISLELFNRAVWKMDPLDAATSGLVKTRKAMEG